MAVRVNLLACDPHAPTTALKLMTISQVTRNRSRAKLQTGTVRILAGHDVCGINLLGQQSVKMPSSHLRSNFLTNLQTTIGSKINAIHQIIQQTPTSRVRLSEGGGWDILL